MVGRPPQGRPPITTSCQGVVRAPPTMLGGGCDPPKPLGGGCTTVGAPRDVGIFLKTHSFSRGITI